MEDDFKTKIKALVLISEMTNSVIIHFDGFDDLDDATDFCNYMIDELGIIPFHYTLNKTIH